ncbi:hypothetical protein BJ944DRAFT_245029 [Cunninghamella echinulata]|nr:hypothetical protein BJ944DRAFT_245029 [Cunninghamella echinulata]
MDELDNFIDIEDLINEESFMKNIKRMFIMRKMEEYKINNININFDNNTKSFKIYIEKENENYYLDYKVKRRIRNNDKSNSKKRKIVNNIVKDGINKRNENINVDNNIDDFDFPKNSLTQNISNNEATRKVLSENNLEAKKVNNNLEKINKKTELNKSKKEKETKVDKLNYKNDSMCLKLFKYIKLFIKTNSINNNEEYKYVREVLKEVENIFNNFGIIKNIARDG